MIKRAQDGSPWFQNSWPWFIVILLGVSVVGSLATVYLAYAHRDFEIAREAVVNPDAEPDDGR